MARPRSAPRGQLIQNSMRLFWANGYEATSIDDIVRATEVGRSSIYSSFGGKKALFLACLDHYSATIVAKALAAVEASDADLSAIETFFTTHLNHMKKAGTKQRGCLIVNTATELGRSDADIFAAVTAYQTRLRTAFAQALKNEFPSFKGEHDRLADHLVISAYGLFAFSKTCHDPAILRQYVTDILDHVRMSCPSR